MKYSGIVPILVVLVACTETTAPVPQPTSARVDTVYVVLEVCTRPGDWPAPDPALPPR